MANLSFRRHRHKPDVIRQAVWLYYRFSLSLRDVEDILAERGIDASYEAIRNWCRKFGRQIARNLKRRRPAPSPRWHLDEMICRIGGRHMYLWRAVDDEGEVLGRPSSDAETPKQRPPSSRNCCVISRLGRS